MVRAPHPSTRPPSALPSAPLPSAPPSLPLPRPPLLCVYACAPPPQVPRAATGTATLTTTAACPSPSLRCLPRTPGASAPLVAQASLFDSRTVETDRNDVYAAIHSYTDRQRATPDSPAVGRYRPLPVQSAIARPARPAKRDKAPTRAAKAANRAAQFASTQAAEAEACALAPGSAVVRIQARQRGNMGRAAAQRRRRAE